MPFYLKQTSFTLFLFIYCFVVFADKFVVVVILEIQGAPITDRKTDVNSIRCAANYAGCLFI